MNQLLEFKCPFLHLLAGCTSASHFISSWRLSLHICKMGKACYLPGLLPGATAYYCLSIKHSLSASTRQGASPALSFFFFLIFFFFWLCWVFVAVCRLSLVAASGGYSSLQCTGFSLRWLLSLWSTGSRCMASVVVEHGLSSCGSRALEHRLSSCGAWA